MICDYDRPITSPPFTRPNNPDPSTKIASPPVQRTLSFQQSFVFLCLGLALWLSVQDVLWQRLGLAPLTAILPEDPAVPDPAAPDSVTADGAAIQTNFPPGALRLVGLSWNSRLGPALGPAVALLTDAQPLAAVPESQGETGRVVVDLSDRRVYLYSDRTSQRAIAQYDIAIGQDGWETPPGRYLIEAMQTDPTWQHPLTQEIIPPGPRNPLGAAWISFLTTQGYSLGLHGTLDESLVGQAVSHGCIRMRNRDILALYEQVAVGWPLDVQP